jgi:lipooligosaccharide transport system permease protein
MAFATPVAAFAITQDTEVAFSTLFRLVFVPLFLFSGTFFPLSQLPPALQVVAWLTPLSHGVALCRDCAFGHLGLADLGHAGYLVAVASAGVVVALRTYARRLVV